MVIQYNPETERRAYDTLDKRLALMEQETHQFLKTRSEEIKDYKATKRAIWSIAIVILLEAGAGIYAYGQAMQELKSMTQTRTDVSTALAVLSSHGLELETVRAEQQRIRGSVDELYRYQVNYNDKLDEKTKNRFYRNDGDRLENRIERLEQIIFTVKNENSRQ